MPRALRGRIEMAFLLLASLVSAHAIGDPSTLQPTTPVSQQASDSAANQAQSWIRAPLLRDTFNHSAPGMTVELLTYEQPRPLRLWVVTIDSSTPGLEFVVTEPNPQTGADGQRYETRCETTLDFARRLDLQLAVNTSAFGPGRAIRGQPMDVAGLAAFQGSVYSESVKSYGAMYIARDGRIELNGPPLHRNGVWNVVAGFRMLLDDGQYVVDDDVFETAFGGLNPRTAVGVDKSGRRSWIVVADGRNRGRSMGLTLPELAALFRWLGAWDALNLDGGGSSTLVCVNSSGVHEVLNEPINAGRPGQMRQVANNLGIRLSVPVATDSRLRTEEGLRKSSRRFRLEPHHDLTNGAKTLRLTHDVRLDPALQAKLEAMDESLARSLGISDDQRAFGVVDLKGPQVAMINGDKMYYGASVPKIAIVFEYLRQHPGFIEQPRPDVFRELQLVIKRSDNELAAKYGKLAELNRIQAMLLSNDYRFYDETNGGGIWCGKYYGFDEPRIGDPLKDLSHAASVRQCLRFFLMLEQDRLGGRPLCDRLRMIFSAPWLEFHDDNFVAGLNGMGLTMIRKNGLWEDWHLDTARVALSDRPVLLAGIVHHPKGPDYLSRMSRSIVMHLQNAAETVIRKPWQAFQHNSYILFHEGDDAWVSLGPPMRLDLLDSAQPVELMLDSRGRARLEWPVAVCDAKFNELLLSWNIKPTNNVSYAIDISVGRRFDNFWSPWLNIDQTGTIGSVESPTKNFDGGRVDVDYFVSKERFDRFKARLRLRGEPNARAKIQVARVVATTSDTTGRPDSWRDDHARRSIPTADKRTRRLRVPFRSQRTASPEIAGRICSPTSLAMVMAYHGKRVSTLDVANACYDPTADIYGNWPRNISAAFDLGVGGYLTRFNNWAAVAHHIAEGQPVIASIRIRKDGLIGAAPYQTTDGHLIVVCGFDENGDVYVNDPAVADPEAGARVYKRSELEEAWFGGSGGVAYILLPTRPASETSEIKSQ